MTKKAKTMVKIILILLAIYVGLTGYASVIFFQGKMNEIAVDLLAINYAIFLTILKTVLKILTFLKLIILILKK